MLNKIKENWFFIGVFLVIITAVYFPFLGIAIKDYIKYLIFFGMFLIGLRLELKQIIKSAGKIKAISFCMMCSFLAMPLISIGLGLVFFRNNPVFFIGVVMAGAVATTQASSIIWTDQSKGNTNLALVLMSISNILGIFVMPLILFLVLRTSLDLPVVGMIKKLFLIILLPALVGMLIVRFSGNGFSILEKPSRITNIVIIWLVVLTAFSNGNFELSTAALAFVAVPIQYALISLLSYYGAMMIGLNRRDSIAVMFCSSQKTITVATVIVFAYFEPSTIIYLFMYHIFQQIMGQIHARAFTSHKT